jgi:hypothetical protein
MNMSVPAKKLIVSAKRAGLRYVTDQMPGIRRIGALAQCLDLSYT